MAKFSDIVNEVLLTEMAVQDWIVGVYNLIKKDASIEQIKEYLRTHPAHSGRSSTGIDSDLEGFAGGRKFAEGKWHTALGGIVGKSGKKHSEAAQEIINYFKNKGTTLQAVANEVAKEKQGTGDSNAGRKIKKIELVDKKDGEEKKETLVGSGANMTSEQSGSEIDKKITFFKEVLPILKELVDIESKKGSVERDYQRKTKAINEPLENLGKKEKTKDSEDEIPERKNLTSSSEFYEFLKKVEKIGKTEAEAHSHELFNSVKSSIKILENVKAVLSKAKEERTEQDKKIILLYSKNSSRIDSLYEKIKPQEIKILIKKKDSEGNVEKEITISDTGREKNTSGKFDRMAETIYKKKEGEEYSVREEFKSKNIDSIVKRIREMFNDDSIGESDPVEPDEYSFFENIFREYGNKINVGEIKNFLDKKGKCYYRDLKKAIFSLINTIEAENKSKTATPELKDKGVKALEKIVKNLMNLKTLDNSEVSSGKIKEIKTISSRIKSNLENIEAYKVSAIEVKNLSDAIAKASAIDKTISTSQNVSAFNRIKLSKDENGFPVCSGSLFKKTVIDVVNSLEKFAEEKASVNSHGVIDNITVVLENISKFVNSRNKRKTPEELEELLAKRDKLAKYQEEKLEKAKKIVGNDNTQGNDYSELDDEKQSINTDNRKPTIKEEILYILKNL